MAGPCYRGGCLLHAVVVATCVLGLCLPSGIAAAQSKCPAWLEEYQQFHKTERLSSQAKFLIAVAPSLGFGDRYRSFLFALRVAAATRRILLCTWGQPGHITDFLEPTGDIDWRYNGTAAEDLLSRNQHMRNSADVAFVQVPLFDKDPSRNPMYRKWTSVPPQNIITSKKFLVMRSNMYIAGGCLFCPEVKSAVHSDAVCMANALFRTTQKVKELADQQLQQLYLNAQQPADPDTNHQLQEDTAPIAKPPELNYVAIHLRLGRFAGEENSIDRLVKAGLDPLSALLRAMACAQQLAQGKGIDTNKRPILLLTDHRELRHFAQLTHLSHVVSPDYDAMHIVGGINPWKPRDTELQNVYNIFVDLELLARATCLIESDSGFSTAGWLLGGGKRCTMQVEQCLIKFK